MKRTNEDSHRGNVKLNQQKDQVIKKLKESLDSNTRDE